MIRRPRPGDCVWCGRSCLRKSVSLQARAKILAQVRRMARTRSTGQPSIRGFQCSTTVGVLLGVLTRRDLLGAGTDAETVGGSVGLSNCRNSCTTIARYQAADHMVRHDIGRLPVLSRASPASDRHCHAERYSFGVPSRAGRLPARGSDAQSPTVAASTASDRLEQFVPPRSNQGSHFCTAPARLRKLEIANCCRARAPWRR